MIINIKIKAVKATELTTDCYDYDVDKYIIEQILPTMIEFEWEEINSEDDFITSIIEEHYK